MTQGYSLAYGARFLKRVIDDRIKLPLSQHWKDGSHFEVASTDGEMRRADAVQRLVGDDAIAYGDVA